MPRLSWSPRSLADLKRLHRFLAPKDREAANRAIATIRQGVVILKRHPQIGRPAGEDTDLREWPIRFGESGYVALYRFRSGRVVVLSVRHFREAG